MGRSWKRLSLTLLFGPLLCGALVYGVLTTKDRFTPLYTLTDDRAALVINENFRRALNILIEDRRFGELAASGSASKTVILNVGQESNNYGVFLTPSWNAHMYVVAKTKVNFTVEYVDPGLTDLPFDWILVR